MEMETPTPLEYAPRNDRRRYRRTILRFVGWALILGIAGWIYYHRVDLSLRARRLYWSHRCMIHVTPPGTVLVERDPIKAAHLLATNPDYVADGKQWIFPTNYALSMGVRSREQFSAVYWPMELRKYQSVDYVPESILGGTNAIAFLGERVSPGGHHRLVVVPVAEVNGMAIKFDLQASTLILAPPTKLGAPVEHPSRGYNFSGGYEPALLSAGVADSSDLSHLSIDFTIPETNNPRHGTLDVYLRDDDTLDCRIRDPATTQGL